MNFRKGISVGAASNVISFVLSFLSVVVVSRLLTPAEIGVFSVAISVLGISHVFREFGVAQYLVQAKSVGDQEFRAAFSVTLITSWSIAVLLFICRHPFAEFYSHDGIADVLALISFNFLIMPFGTPILALLTRELEFGKLAAIRISYSLVASVVTIVAAWSGESYLSMTWGAIAGQLSNVILLNIIRPGRIFVLPNLKGIGDVFRFGSLATVSSLLAQFGLAMPELILGRTLGFSAVAFYSRADGLRNMALGQLLALVRGVHFPSFAKGLREGEDPAELYSKVMVYLVAVAAPAMALAAIIANPLIIFLFGPQWEKASILATMICTMTVLTSPYTMAQPSLIASNNLKLLIVMQAAMEIMRAVVLLSSIWLPLEAVVAGLLLTSIVNNGLYQWALSTAYNLEFFVFMKRIKISILLVPYTVFGPALLFFLHPSAEQSPLHYLSVILLSTVLGLSGWLLGVHIMNHPIKNEITLAVAGVSSKVQAMKRRGA